MEKSIKKFLILFLIIGLNSSAIFAVGNTRAYFSNEESSTGNTYQAGTLDLAVSPENLGDVILDEGTNFNVANDGSLDFQYRLKTTTDSDDYCQNLDLSLVFDSNIYTGKLGNFSGATTTSVNMLDNWQIKITDTSDNLGDNSCSFNLIIQGWQNEFENYNSASGFSDEEIVGGSVAAGIAPPPEPVQPNPGEIVINEIIPDPSGTDDGNEWVELYNPTSKQIDISGLIGGNTSNSDQFTIPANTYLDPHTFYLIGETNITKADLTANLTITNTGSNANFIIKNQSSQQIDKLGWDSSSSEYETAPSQTPGSGKSLERYPVAGTDTDNNSNDFQVNATPTPTNSAGVDCPEVVLNEFLPNAGSYPEFIELYNRGDEPDDLNGWEIRFENSTDIITISNQILYGLATAATINPGDWLTIDLSKVNLNILNDNSERIYLYDNSGNLKDEVFYPLSNGSNGCITPNGQNIDGCVINPVNKSYARIPDGVGAWIDPIPTPGGTNATPENLYTVAELENQELEPDLIDNFIEPTPALISDNYISTPENIIEQPKDSSNETPENLCPAEADSLADVVEGEEIIDTPADPADEIIVEETPAETQTEVETVEQPETVITATPAEVQSTEIALPEPPAEEPVAPALETPAPDAGSGGDEE